MHTLSYIAGLEPFQSFKPTMASVLVFYCLYLMTDLFPGPKYALD